jgi:hypothetical protein
MKLLLDKGCYIEDRRAEPSRGKPSLIVQETCAWCRKSFVYIVAEADASNVSDVCKPCHDSMLVLEFYDENGVCMISPVAVSSLEVAEKRLQEISEGAVSATLWDQRNYAKAKWVRQDGVWVAVY